MDKSGIYVYIDKQTIEVHKEEAYHQGGDGRHYVELTDPIRLYNLSELSDLVGWLWPEFDPKSDV